ncbi:MAG: cell division protein ZapA [Clostridia bacterium]|nr:cell division protein ZapA [Clostridia bacterium]
MEENEKKSTAVVRINGADYTIVSTADEEYVRHVAYYVDKKMQELCKNDRRLSTAMAAVLTSVNIADDYFRSQSDNESLRAQLLKYAEEAGAMRSAVTRMESDVKRLTEENQSLRVSNARLDAELKARTGQTSAGAHGGR